MPYITIADLETRYGADEIVKLADRDGDSVADADVVAAAIEDTCQVIDSYLSSIYQTPFNPVPGLVTRLACAIARYHLYDDKPTEHVSGQYNAAIETLRAIRNGEIILGLAAPAVSESGSGPEFTEGSKRFTDSGLKGH